MHYKDRYELSPARAVIVALLLLVVWAIIDVPETEPLTWMRLLSAGLIGLVALGVINQWGHRLWNWFDDFWWRINRCPPDPSAFTPMDERNWRGPSDIQRRGL
jgi:hypothetical protein